MHSFTPERSRGYEVTISIKERNNARPTENSLLHRPPSGNTQPALLNFWMSSGGCELLAQGIRLSRHARFNFNPLHFEISPAWSLGGFAAAPAGPLAPDAGPSTAGGKIAPAAPALGKAVPDDSVCQYCLKVARSMADEE